MAYYYGWKPYVSVAKRRHQAHKEMQRLRKKGVEIQPVEIEGRKIAKTFWGEAWCSHMESRGDLANRLPRGRTYVRNGSVCHLEIRKGQINAMVSGSEIYNVVIKIDMLPRAKWKTVQRRCGGQIGSLLELLQGRISDSVMDVVTDPKHGLFPLPKELHLTCDCPDYATMCKHVSAVLYGVGARLDREPELLFVLRGVNHLDLVAAPAAKAITQATKRGNRRRVDSSVLGDVFGIDLESDAEVQRDSKTASRKRKSPRKKAKVAKKKTGSRRAAKSTKPKAGKQATPIADSKPATNKRRQAKKKTTTKNERRRKSTAAGTTVKKKATSPKKQSAKKKVSAAKKTKRVASKTGKRKKSAKDSGK